MTNREYIEAMVKKAKAAVDQVENYDQAQTDLMCKVAAKVCWDNAKLLGTTAYEKKGPILTDCTVMLCNPAKSRNIKGLRANSLGCSTPTTALLRTVPVANISKVLAILGYLPHQRPPRSRVRRTNLVYKHIIKSQPFPGEL